MGIHLAAAISVPQPATVLCYWHRCCPASCLLVCLLFALQCTLALRMPGSFKWQMLWALMEQTEPQLEGVWAGFRSAVVPPVVPPAPPHHSRQPAHTWQVPLYLCTSKCEGISHHQSHVQTAQCVDAGALPAPR